MKKVKIKEVEKQFLDLFEQGLTYDTIANTLNISKSAISTYVKNNGLIHPSKRHTINTSAFENLTEEDVYWLGFLWADGYVQNTDSNKTIDLEITDLDHAEKFKDFIGANKISTRIRNNSLTYRVSVSSKILVERLYSLGFNLKDRRIEFPNIPKDKLAIFIRGYFDGDGHIRIKDSRFEGIDISGRIEFITLVYETFPLFCRIENHSTHSARIYTTKSCGKEFLNLIYKEANVYLNRKYVSALPFRE